MGLADAKDVNNTKNTRDDEIGIKYDISGTPTIGDSKVFFLDPNRRKKKYDGTGETTTFNSGFEKTSLISDEVFAHIKIKRAENEISSFPVNFQYLDAYTNSRISQEKRVKEAMEKMQKIQTKFTLYKYYSTIWVISALLAGGFAISGVSGLLAPFPSISGVLATITGMIGAFIDWKDREKKYDA